MATLPKHKKKMMMNNIDKIAQKEMSKALKEYKEDKNSAKEFYPCTQKLNIWLKEKMK